MYERAPRGRDGSLATIDRGTTVAVGKRTQVELAGPPAGASSEGGGVPLPAATRAKFERAYGESFADVRVHESGEPAALGAGAFARGHHIHVAPGRLAPGTEAGDRLLGHELAHVVQQRGGRVPGEGGEVNGDAALEAEADASSARAARGEIVREGSARGVQGMPGAPGAPDRLPVQAAPIQCDQRDQARVPTADQQTDIGYHLDPGRRPRQPGQQQPPWTGNSGEPDYKAQRANLGTRIFDGLRDFRHQRAGQVDEARTARRVPLSQPGLGGDTGMVGIAQQAQLAITARYGAWLANGARGGGAEAASTGLALRAGHEVIDGNDKDARAQALGVGNTAYAGDTAMWAARYHDPCAQALRDHHWTSSDLEAKPFLQSVVTEWLKHPEYKQFATDYHTYCINEQKPGALIMDLTTAPSRHGGDADEAERAKRWQLFGKAVHELMHGCAHPAFVAATRGRGVMLEGFTEYFAGLVTAPLLDAAASGNSEALRLVVEGSVSGGGARPITAYTTPGDYRAVVDEVRQLVTRRGEQALLAAFFQGHVEFLGLAPDGKALPGDALRPGDRTHVPLRVPKGFKDLSELAWCTNITTDAIRHSNQLDRDQEDIKAYDELILPGCREHVIVGTAGGAVETVAQVAAQHGVTRESLLEANPDRPFDQTRSWTGIRAGDVVLIPSR